MACSRPPDPMTRTRTCQSLMGPRHRAPLTPAPVDNPVLGTTPPRGSRPSARPRKRRRSAVFRQTPHARHPLGGFLPGGGRRSPSGIPDARRRRRPCRTGNDRPTAAARPCEDQAKRVVCARRRCWLLPNRQRPATARGQSVRPDGRRREQVKRVVAVRVDVAGLCRTGNGPRQRVRAAPGPGEIPVKRPCGLMVLCLPVHS